MAKNKAKPTLYGPDGNWQAENDLRTYLEWCEVQKDPQRMEAMKKLAKEKLGDYARAASAVGKNVDVDD